VWIRETEVNEPAKLQGDLREGCLVEAMGIIKDRGLEELSLREVARRLGVSHQAPYRHFPSRDHLLAEVVDRAFRRFDDFLAQAGVTEDPRADLQRMGQLYLEYAARFPLEYRLMFGAKLPRVEEHPQMMERGCGAFDQLRDVLARMVGGTRDDAVVTAEAMFAWSTIHGLASILQTEAMGNLGIDADLQRAVSDHVLGRIDAALAPVHGATPPA